MVDMTLVPPPTTNPPENGVPSGCVGAFVIKILYMAQK